MLRAVLQNLKCLAFHARDVDDVSASGHRIIRCHQGCPTRILAKPLSHIQRQNRERSRRDVWAVLR